MFVPLNSLGSGAHMRSYSFPACMQIKKLLSLSGALPWLLQVLNLRWILENSIISSVKKPNKTCKLIESQVSDCYPWKICFCWEQWELLPDLAACVQKWVSQHTTICLGTGVKIAVKFRSYPAAHCSFCMWWSGSCCWFDFYDESEIPERNNSGHGKVILKYNQPM